MKRMTTSGLFVLLLSTSQTFAFGHEADLGGSGGPSVPDAVADSVEVPDSDEPTIRDAEDVFGEDYEEMLLAAAEAAGDDSGDEPRAISLLDGREIDWDAIVDAVARTRPSGPVAGDDHPETVVTRDMVVRAAQAECAALGGARLIVRGWRFACEGSDGQTIRP